MNQDTSIQNQRLSVLFNHLYPSEDIINKALLSHEQADQKNSDNSKNEKNSFEKRRTYVPTPSIVPKNYASKLPNELQKSLKTIGWGFNDTEFLLKPNGDVTVSGNRYPVLSSKSLPNFREFFEKEAGLDASKMSLAQSIDEILVKVPKENIYEPFLNDLKKEKCYKYLVHDAESRLMHSHGHSLQEIFRLRYGTFNRVVDLVIYPDSHEHVEQIVKIALRHKEHICLIPYGGGTTVTQTLLCPENETRCIVSIDTHEMNRIVWVDKENNTACIQAGCNGVQIHDQLKERGVTLGHEPDSWEFSTMGGWVATRASGMKKNQYGNIEEILLHAKVVTPQGTIDAAGSYGRKSHGPNVIEMILGSEGCFGIVTECIVKVHPFPKVKRYGAIVFPNFQSGVACFKEVYESGLRPAALRLVDNMNFRMGGSLKERKYGFEKKMHAIEDAIKKLYVIKLKGLKEDQICAATLCLEGDHHEVAHQEKQILRIASKYGGINGGSEAGKQGFLLTYVIAYLRDYAMSYYFLAESFETCVPWSKVNACVDSVKQRIREEGKRRGIVDPQPWVCARVSQSYSSGACCYFYFGFVFKGLKDPVKVFSEIEDAAREEILIHGGALSHHHGVGKIRKRWMKEIWGEQAFNLIKQFKTQIDPSNLFGSNNMDIGPAKITFEEQYIVKEHSGTNNLIDDGDQSDSDETVSEKNESESESDSDSSEIEN